jgi:cell wall assembly regulator SMI1
MYTNAISKINNPTSINEIQLIESQIGISLPNDYKRFLLDTNGGRPQNDVFDRILPEDSNPIETSLRNFLSVDELLRVWNNIKEYEEIEEGMVIPIALTAGSPIVCIGIGEANNGEIYVWDAFGLTLQSSSLQEFIDSLRTEP